MNGKELKPESAYFRQTRIKLQNSALGNDAAWTEAQPVLIDFVPGYPEEYQDQTKTIRAIFDIRRQTFLQVQKMGSNSSQDNITAKNEVMKQATQLIVGRLSQFDPQTQERLRQPMVLIRDFFDIPVPPTGRRRG